MSRRASKRGKKPGIARTVNQDGSIHRSLFVVGGIVVAVALIMVVLAIMSRQPGETVKTLGNEHIAAVNVDHAPYNTDPPTSGPHTEGMAPWGVRNEPVPDENQVHNLEDGGVVVQYDDGVGAGQVRKLATLVGDYETVILAPRPALPKGQIAVTSWGRIMRLDTVDEDKIRDFISTFQGQDHHVTG